MAAIVVSHATKVRPIEPSVQADLNLLLEMVCYSQRGNWSVFERLATQVNDAPWFPLEVARLFSSLGHIDLVLDRRTLRPVFWCVAPSVLALLPDAHTAVLCGYRSESLLDRMAERVKANGGALAIESNPDCPPRVRVDGLDVEALRAVCDSTSAETGWRLRFVKEPALRVARRLPSLASIAPMLSTFVPPAGVAIERFDLDNNRWVSVPDIDETGAYRFLTRPVRYGFLGRTAELTRKPLVADSRLVKWLAAADSGIAMMAYESATKSLICRLGGQFPGLFERAAVLCSGLAPIRQVDATVVYREVPEQVASALWRALGSRLEDEVTA